MNTGTDFAKHLSKFLSEYLPFERNMNPNTIASYRDAFVQFIGHMKDVQKIRVEQLTLETFTRHRVLDFLSWVQKERSCSIATRNQRLAAIHSFLAYLQYEEIHHLDEWQKILSIKAMKDAKKSISYLTTDGIKLLLEQQNRLQVDFCFQYYSCFSICAYNIFHDCCLLIVKLQNFDLIKFNLDKN